MKIGKRGGSGALMALVLMFAIASVAEAAPFVRTDYAHTAGVDPVTADFNGDGDADIATVLEGSVRVFLGSADATVSDPVTYAAGAGAYNLDVADMNGDGDPDLVVTSNGDSASTKLQVGVLLGGTGGTFGAFTPVAEIDKQTFVGMADIEVADFNGDGDPDFAVQTVDALVFVAGPGLTFTEQPGTYGTGSVLESADFNGDGDLDLATANGSGVDAQVTVRLGGTGATFGEPTYLPASGAAAGLLAIADVNGDDDPDLVVPHGTTGGPVDGHQVSTFSVFLGEAGGGFADPTSIDMIGDPEAVAAGDFNDDGDPDLAFATYSDQVRFYAGGPGGSFTPGPALPDGGMWHGIVTGDFDQDGATDFAVTYGSTYQGSEVGSLYMYRRIMPTVPSNLGMSPSSPAKNTTPKITGTADPGTTVRVYKTADCSGTPVASGTADEFASPGISLTVPAASTTTLRVTAFDGLSASACSAAVEYQEVSPTLNISADSHPQPPFFVPFALSGIAPVASSLVYIASGPDETCEPSFNAQWPKGQSLGVDYVGPGSYAVTNQGVAGTHRICAYLYEQEPGGGYDYSQPADAQATVITSNGPAPVDTDSDGTVDGSDQCPTVPGPPSLNGCPPTPVGNTPTSTPSGPSFFPQPNQPNLGAGFTETDAATAATFTLAKKGSLKKFLKKGAAGSIKCSLCAVNATVKLPASVAKKLRLKSATIGSAKIGEAAGTVALAFRLSKALKAKLGKLRKVVLSVAVTVEDRYGKRTLPAKKITLTK